MKPISDPQLRAINTMCHYVSTHIEAGHTVADPGLLADLTTLRRDIDAVLGPEEADEIRLLRDIDAAITSVAVQVARTTTLQQQTLDGQADLSITLLRVMDDASLIPVIADEVAAIYEYVVPPWTAVLTYTYHGRTFGRTTNSKEVPAVAVSILDTDQGWGVAVGALADAEGQPVDPSTVTIALSVADATLIALTDNGNGSATFGSAVVAGSGVVLPASTALSAVVTNPDGTSFVLTDVITVVASDAVTGSFTFTPPA